MGRLGAAVIALIWFLLTRCATIGFADCTHLGAEISIDPKIASIVPARYAVPIVVARMVEMHDMQEEWSSCLLD